MKITAFFAIRSPVRQSDRPPQPPHCLQGGSGEEAKTWRREADEGSPLNSLLMGSVAWEFLERVDSCRMREEADYPPSFCVWDQDQRANPPLDEERRAKGEDGQVAVRRAKTISKKKKKKG